MLFSDRSDAGKMLASKLQQYKSNNNVLVLGLPRGGVPVAFEIAWELRVELDVFIVRKLGVPGHEELAMGAIAGGILILNGDVLNQMGISKEAVHKVIDDENAELERRENLYRQGRLAHDLEGRCLILVDDGLATGASMRAAVMAARRHEPSKIIVAVPVAAEETLKDLQAEVDEVVCLATPDPFMCVGTWYKNFAQTTDNEVRSLLEIAVKSGRVR